MTDTQNPYSNIDFFLNKTGADDNIGSYLGKPQGMSWLNASIELYPLYSITNYIDNNQTSRKRRTRDEQLGKDKGKDKWRQCFRSGPYSTPDVTRICNVRNQTIIKDTVPLQKK